VANLISLQTDDDASTLHHSVFTGRVPFLPPNKQRQNTGGNAAFLVEFANYSVVRVLHMRSVRDGVLKTTDVKLQDMKTGGPNGRA